MSENVAAELEETARREEVVRTRREEGEMEKSTRQVCSSSSRPSLSKVRRTRSRRFERRGWTHLQVVAVLCDSGSSREHDSSVVEEDVEMFGLPVEPNENVEGQRREIRR